VKTRFCQGALVLAWWFHVKRVQRRQGQGKALPSGGFWTVRFGVALRGALTGVTVTVTERGERLSKDEKLERAA